MRVPSALETETGFPGNVLGEIELSLQDYMPMFQVIRRPVRQTDPERTIGLFLVDWTPRMDSVLIGPQWEPELATYEYRLQLLIKHTDEIEGRRMFGAASKSLKAILYRDPDLVVRLTTLNETVLDVRETVKRFGVRRQRFLNNEIRGSFLYLAATDLWVETESTKL